MTCSAITGAHERVLKKAIGFPPFGLYSLRHTCATWFYDSTKDSVALKEVLGPANGLAVRQGFPATNGQGDERVRERKDSLAETKPETLKEEDT